MAAFKETPSILKSDWFSLAVFSCILTGQVSLPVKVIHVAFHVVIICLSSDLRSAWSMLKNIRTLALCMDQLTPFGLYVKAAVQIFFSIRHNIC